MISLLIRKVNLKLISHYSKEVFQDIKNYSTIYAVSSGQGKCGVTVVRVSGPQSCLVIQQIAKLEDKIPERQALLRRLWHPTTGEVIDRGLVLWFPEPRSFTGEDVCEFHVHGGKAVVSAILSSIGQVEGCQPAQPGEFTKRAFLAGKLDLTEVEGLADLLQAETEAQRKQALLQLEGHLGNLYTRWRKQIIQCMAHVEAFIDFSEDENIEDGILEASQKSAANLLREIQEHLADGRKGEMLRSGVQTSIIGKPNVGKSSLLNALARRPAAIVTPHAGTTRDIVQLSLDLGGFPMLLADTAGLRHSEDEAERQGVERARSLASQADLVLLVAEASLALKQGVSKLPEFLQDYIHQCQLDIRWQDCLIVLNKIDLLPDHLKDVNLPENVILISCETQEGFGTLLNKMQERLGQLCNDPQRENPSLTQARHRQHLENCALKLQNFLHLMCAEADLVLAAEQLRLALRQVGLLTGHVSTEQLLDVIFSDFCIGK